MKTTQTSAVASDTYAFGLIKALRKDLATVGLTSTIAAANKSILNFSYVTLEVVEKAFEKLGWKLTELKLPAKVYGKGKFQVYAHKEDGSSPVQLVFNEFLCVYLLKQVLTPQ